MCRNHLNKYIILQIRDVGIYFRDPDLLDHYTAEVASNLPSYKINEWINFCLYKHKIWFLKLVPFIILRYSIPTFVFGLNLQFNRSISWNVWKINFVIDNMSLSNNEGSSSSDSSSSSDDDSGSNGASEDDIEAIREHYRILNYIRFGPEDSNIYDEKIKKQHDSNWSSKF